MNFIDFKNAVAKQFDLMCKQPELFRTTASKDDMWKAVLTRAKLVASSTSS